MFFGTIGRRFFHSSRVYLATSQTSLLGKLRKSTGYSISNCKKAVELFPEDIAKAEEYLHAEAKKQGWAKWAKMQARSATQGLVGVYLKRNTAVIVEVNCETDFVAKNVEFQQLVGKILSSCINHSERNEIKWLDDERYFYKAILNETQLNEIPCDASTVGELVNSAVIKFGEKTVVKRIVMFGTDCTEVWLTTHSHPSIPCPNVEGATLGKYGTLMAHKYSVGCAGLDMHDYNFMRDNICPHIIGMNPSSIGELTEEDIQNFKKRNISEESVMEAVDNNQTKGETEKVEDSSVEKTDSETEDHESVVLKDTDEKRLLFQPFLYNPDVTVGELLQKRLLQVVGFERFECGENLAESGEVQQAAQAQ